MSGSRLKQWRRLQDRVEKLEAIEAGWVPNGHWYKRLRFLRLKERIVDQFRKLDEQLTIEGVL